MKPTTLLLQLAATQATLAQSGPFRENNDDLKPLPGGAVEMYTNLAKWMPWFASLSPGAIMKKMLPEGKIVKIVSNTATRKGALSTTSYMGPFTLVGRNQTRPLDTTFSEDPKGQSWMARLNKGLCRNCTILTVKPRVVDADFNPIGPRQGVYVHHIQGRDLSKPGNPPAYQCAIDATGKMTRPSSLDDTLFDDPVMGADLFTWTNDLGESQVDLAPDTGFVGGYHVGPKDEYSIQMDAVNYLNETRTLYVALEIEYLEGLVGDDVSQILLSVQGCEYGGETGTIKLSEKGVAETKSLRFPVRFDGKLVSAIGHLHDGGDSVKLFLNGNEVCTSLPTYKTGGMQNVASIVKMSGCYNEAPMKQGDILTITTTYDIQKHPLRKGSEHNNQMHGMVDVMGMMLITMSHDRKPQEESRPDTEASDD